MVLGGVFVFYLILSIPPPLPPLLNVCDSAQENSSLTSQLASLKQSLQESQEQSARLHSDLRKAKSAAKSPGGGGGGGGADGRGQLERVGELEGRLRQVEEDNASLQVCGMCVCVLCIIACLQAVMISW